MAWHQKGFTKSEKKVVECILAEAMLDVINLSKDRLSILRKIEITKSALKRLGDAGMRGSLAGMRLRRKLLDLEGEQ